jgi:type VI secretion system protein VasL
MTNTVYLDAKAFKVIPNSIGVRDLDAYQQVRDQINRQNSPLAGVTDWALIKKASETLAQSAGMDLIVSGYYTVALLKTQGLQGFANGLELMATAFILQQKLDPKGKKANKELTDWMIGISLKEMKSLRPDYESLRDLYRCEFNISRMLEQFLIEQPTYVPNLDALGFSLFEHIDRIETQAQGNIVKSDRDVVERQHIRRRAGLVGALIGALIITGVTVFMPYLELRGLNYYRQEKVAALNSLQAASRYQNQVGDSKLESLKKNILPLYEHDITIGLATPFFKNQQYALGQLAALLKLYPQDPQVKMLATRINQTKQNALENNVRYVDRFSQIRTQMANLSLLAKSGNLEELQQQTKELEDFAISLSPIYGRTSYIDLLIKDGMLNEADRELATLDTRLINLSWKLADTKLTLLKKKNEMAEVK